MIFIINVLLSQLEKQGLTPGMVTNSQTEATELITEKKELPLSEWLTLYHEGDFEQIKVVNDIDLQGYAFQQTGEKSFLSNSYPTKEYLLYTTHKNKEDSITTLGIVLTGDTTVQVSYVEESFFMKLFDQVGYLLLFFLILFVGMRFLMPKGGPGNIL